MCCFAVEVLDVGQTKIFARLTGDGSQFIAYQMRYKSAEPNAMILPIPVRLPSAEDSIEFIDLSEYSTFFHDLSRGFPNTRSESILATDAKVAPVPELVVHDVGNFVASFVPSVDDFERLDPRFVIPKETWLQIPEYADYGFAVFKLKDLEAETHPMAFRFRTRDESLFFPTVHIHDGEVHEEEEFDHVLYMQNGAFDDCVGEYQGLGKPDRATGVVRSQKVANRFCEIEKSKGLLAPDQLLHRVRLDGKLPNKDTVFTPRISPSVAVEPFGFRQLLAWWPVAIPVAGLAWLIGRRNSLGKTTDKHSDSPSEK